MRVSLCRNMEVQILDVIRLVLRKVSAFYLQSYMSKLTDNESTRYMETHGYDLSNVDIFVLTLSK